MKQNLGDEPANWLGIVLILAVMAIVGLILRWAV